MVNTKLRKGKLHCQKGTPEFLKPLYLKTNLMPLRTVDILSKIKKGIFIK